MNYKNNLIAIISFLVVVKCSAQWNDLKVTWGVNPLSWSNFASLPRTESDALKNKWTLDKSCSNGLNGNRYVLNGDRAVMLIFSSKGLIAGIAAGIPKNLPFNFPSQQQQLYFNDEGDFWSITAYFIDPSSVCSDRRLYSTGDRLVFKSDSFSRNVSLDEPNIEKFWTKGKCFYTMGNHYWANIRGIQLDKNCEPDDFLPIFLLYNKGKLNGFGWAFNANLSSPRYEHPPKSSISGFFAEVPAFFSDPTKSSNKLSTLHIYLDSSPRLNFC